MTALAAACGVFIVVLGIWSTGRNPTNAESAIEITCLVGGLILCFNAVILSRLDKLALRLDAMEAIEPDEREPAPQDGKGKQEKAI